MNFGTCSYRTFTHDRIVLLLSVSVCKMGTVGVLCSIILPGILKSYDEGDKGSSEQLFLLQAFWLYVYNRQ